MDRDRATITGMIDYAESMVQLFQRLGSDPKMLEPGENLAERIEGMRALIAALRFEYDVDQTDRRHSLGR